MHICGLRQQFGTSASARSKRKALTGQLSDEVRAVEAQFFLCDDFLTQFALAGEMGDSPTTAGVRGK
jgi:hypothetical protein